MHEAYFLKNQIMDKIPLHLKYSLSANLIDLKNNDIFYHNR